MKISELIKRLSEIQDKHGNIECRLINPEWGMPEPDLFVVLEEQRRDGKDSWRVSIRWWEE